MATLDAIRVSDIEPLRLNVQAQLDSAKTQEERNRIGQFATPTALATDILTCARSLLPYDAPVRFLDPAFGTGSFYSALNHVFPMERIACAAGYEIDPHYGQQAQQLWRTTSLRLELTDFTRVTPPAAEHEKYNLLICNPPYVRHHHIPSDEKTRLLALVRQATGIQLNGLSGLYCYFMLLCHPWMAQGGLAGWLIPSEFMDVNYGRQVKRYLLEQVTLLRIHRFRPEDVQFGDAMVSSVVVWFRKQQPAAGHVVEFTYGGSLNRPAVTRRIPVEKLSANAKWTGISLLADQDDATPVAGDALETTLGDLFQIKRGIATGANDFFVVSKEQATDLGLPWQFLTPILPSPRYLESDEVLADEEGNPRLTPQLFLVNCSWPEDRVRREQPALWRYLESGQARGIHQRYLATHRTPWYAQEQRQAAPLLCTYMGRQTTGKARPFRFILNHSHATAPNVYLMLYPRPALAAELARNPTLLTSIWTALNRLPPQALIGEGRVYGGGLHKIEPAELANAPVDGIMQLAPAVSRNLGRQLSLFDV
jgi:methylase of polypeptide subunit release factors